MISLVTGTPGAGKTYYAQRKIAEALMGGKVVASNVPLSPGWERIVSGTNPLLKAMPWRRRKIEQRLRDRFYFSREVDELFRVRLAGTKEGRGLMVVDEAHMLFNARTWDQDDTGKGRTKAEAVAFRQKNLRFFSAHRHLGWDILCITQHEDNIDAQLRRNWEFHVKVRNLKNFRVSGLQIVPFNLFQATRFWNDKQKSRAGAERYLLTKVANIYNTHSLAADVDQEHEAEGIGDVIMLPRPPGTTPPSTPPRKRNRGVRPDRRTQSAGPDAALGPHPGAVTRELPVVAEHDTAIDYGFPA